MPNLNEIAAPTLARIARHQDCPGWEDRARAALRGYAKDIEQLPRAFGSSLNALDFSCAASLELVLVGTPGDAGYEALAAELGRRYLRNRVEERLRPDHTSRLPLTAGKTALYVCQNFACNAPVTRVTDAAWLLDSEGRCEEVI